MRETVASNVNSRLIVGTMQLNAIAKIRKYKGFHDGYCFISMAMEVHCTPGRDMDHFIRSIFSTIDDQKVIYPYIFAFNFLDIILVLFFNML